MEQNEITKENQKKLWELDKTAFKVKFIYLNILENIKYLRKK